MPDKAGPHLDQERSPTSPDTRSAWLWVGALCAGVYGKPRSDAGLGAQVSQFTSLRAV